MKLLGVDVFLKTTVGLFTVAACFFGVSICGFYTSMLSLSPAHTGTLSSISMTVAILGRIATPFIIGQFRIKGEVDEWIPIFWYSGGIWLINSIFFSFLSTAKPQNWKSVAVVKKDKKSKTSKGAVVDEHADLASIPLAPMSDYKGSVLTLNIPDNF
uniref:MFS domain-containing protein n=1 Tax=Rhabditophanes sp. KR3021 TaxID=114890 RepID=A0AC35U7M8_9BILA